MSTIVDILRETEEVQPIPGRKWARALRQEQLQEQRRHGPVDRAHLSSSACARLEPPDPVAAIFAFAIAGKRSAMSASRCP